MSITSIKVSPPEAAATPAVTRPTVDSADFAAVARTVAAPETADNGPVTMSPGSERSDGIGALAGMLAEGNLEAARAALARLGATGPAAMPQSQATPGTKIGNAAANGRGADTSATAAAGNAKVVDVGSNTATEDIDVHRVWLALATGNAGNIPAAIINLYGPGGALYDPAAIMNAYRASEIGQAQMAAMAWIGKPA